MHILHTFADKENLYNNQEFLWLLIISYVLITLMCDSGRYFKEKLKSLLGVRELNLFLDSQVNNYVTLSL